MPYRLLLVFLTRHLNEFLLHLFKFYVQMQQHLLAVSPRSQYYCGSLFQICHPCFPCLLCLTGSGRCDDPGESGGPNDFCGFGGSGGPGDPAGGPDGSVESGGASDPWSKDLGCSLDMLTMVGLVALVILGKCVFLLSCSSSSSS